MVKVGEETSTAATFSPVETWPTSMVVSSEAEASSFPSWLKGHSHMTSALGKGMAQNRYKY